jgi:hypothetical protein
VKHIDAGQEELRGWKMEDRGQPMRTFSIFHFPSSILYPVLMFDTITAEIGTAAHKLAHLRRFL